MPIPRLEHLCRVCRRVTEDELHVLLHCGGSLVLSILHKEFSAELRSINTPMLEGTYYWTILQPTKLTLEIVLQYVDRVMRFFDALEAPDCSAAVSTEDLVWYVSIFLRSLYSSSSHFS